MTEEKMREMARSNYAAQMEALGYGPDGMHIGEPKQAAQLVPRELLLNTWGHGWKESHLIGDDEEPEAFILSECVWINGRIMIQDGSNANAAGHYWEEHYGKRYGVRVWTGDEKPTDQQRAETPWT